MKRSPVAQGGLPRSLFAVAVAVALAASISFLTGSAGATHRPAAGQISARLSEKVFTSGQAVSIKLIYRYSKPTRAFAYRLDFKAGAKWQPVRSARSTKKKGYLRGPQTVTVKTLFAGKAVRLGSYRLELRIGSGSKLIGFKVVEARTFKSLISADGDFTCAVSSGSVRCWGFNTDGQLGDGTTTTRSVAVAVKAVSGATQVSSGYDYACALLPQGRVKCWGANYRGQLGDGTTRPSSTPVAVAGISKAIGISAGAYPCALFASGKVKCWGTGAGGGVSGSAPIQVPGISSAVQLSGACVLLADGTVECWNYYLFGALYRISGLGHVVQLDSDCAVLASGTVKCWSGEMTTVAGISNAVQVSRGGGFCAVLSGGTVKCWGYGTPARDVGITNAVQVSVGNAHTCALLSGGAVKCWGLDYSGQLGDGTTNDSPAPVGVIGIP